MLFRLPAEPAHSLGLWAIRLGLDRFLLDRFADEPDTEILEQRLWGRTFSNPIGLAAGFDKDAKVWRGVQRWGFGFVEVGTLTPRPQKGNDTPRVFRLEADEAIINSMGFNNAGLSSALSRIPPKSGRPTVIGINIGKNRDSSDPAADYEFGVLRAARHADYLVINVSSPNTPGLRDLQRRTQLNSLLHRLIEVRDRAHQEIPMLLKISPDLTSTECQDIAGVVLSNRIDGLIISNTTTNRTADLASANAHREGGLSGRPLFNSSTALLAEMYGLTQGRLPLIGVGGVSGARDAYEKIRAGASLVQIHTALIFSGPAIVSQIKRGLVDLLRRDGFGSIKEAVGTAHRPKTARQALVAV
jgi:dihydroorotate dehydrogenase